MPIFVDARIPVVFANVATAGPDDALLAEEEAPPVGKAPPVGEAPSPRSASHGATCTCCVPRSAIAETLFRLFLARARAETPFFRRVVVAAAGPEAETRVRLAIEGDIFLSGRYRLAT
jgi:hypothetical protein